MKEKISLKEAFEQGWIEVCILLLSNGVQLPPAGLFADSYKDTDGNNILHKVLTQAAIVTPSCVSQILQSRPSFLRTTNKDNEFPVQVALRHGVAFDIIAMLLDAHPFSKSELKTFLASAGDYTHYRKRDIEFLGHAFQYSKTVNCVNLHFVGNSMVGKTTARTALRHTLRNTDIISSLFHRMPSRVASIDKDDRTIGLECEIIEVGDRKYLLWDYGGQVHFHVNHGPFLSLAGSIYVIVLSVCDFVDGRVFENHEIESAYKYWARVLNSVARKDGGKNVITIINGKEFDLAQPWRKARMIDLAGEKVGETLHPSMDIDVVRNIAAKHKIKTDAHWGSGRIIEEIFAELAEGDLQEPTFVTGHPVEISPLARADRNDPHLTERFELFIGARELANGYSELNDPVEQRLRFEDEQKAKVAGDNEAGSMDEDYLRALEFGMPPTAGLGIGIDRLVMLLAAAGSIKDVILFPTLRPEAK
jgi:hypothetical protein